MLRLNVAHSSLSEIFSDFQLIFLNPDIDVCRRSKDKELQSHISAILA